MSKSNNQIAVDIVKEAYEQNELVLFVGAGMSVGSGLPNWVGLLRPLAEEIGLTISTRPNHEELTQIAQKFERAKGHALLDKRIREAILKPNAQPNQQHRLIANSNIGQIYTTNYDGLIEQAFRDAGKQGRKVVRPRDIAGSKPEVFKICGDIEDADSLVIRFEDYHFFEEEKKEFVDLLKADLMRQTFLFIGYSFGDPFLQKLILRAFKSGKGIPSTKSS